ncbi:uncharacterized protein LOC134770710 [Penaeus indicus]|uniref:uncharacterized protein LOC134770710 n=1 Tax=Penaeus indicus TaxID=29960 RepID=UPI00300C6FC9
MVVNCVWASAQQLYIVQSTRRNDLLRHQFSAKCDREIEARRPDIVVVDKQKREVKIIDIAIPGDVRVCEKEIEKIDKYKPLKDEIARLWQMQKVTVIPVVVGALGAITNWLGKFMQEIGIEICIEHVQKTALLGTARVLRLECFITEAAQGPSHH